MARIEDTVYCDGCGVEIIAAPVVSDSQLFCCADCRDGYECSCGDAMELEDDRMSTTRGSSVTDLTTNLF